MDKYKSFSIGDRVTVKQNDEAYDKHGTITPGMLGTIKNFAPKVRIVSGEIKDRLPYFAYVVFDKTLGVHNNPVRGGINLCNLVKVKP
jgi:hypothetical protein